MSNPNDSNAETRKVALQKTEPDSFIIMAKKLTRGIIITVLFLLAIIGIGAFLLIQKYIK